MAALDDVFAGLAAGQVIPYLGPGALATAPGSEVLPGSPAQLVQRLTARASVPHKIRNNLTAAAQFIENFKHRKTVVKAMTEAFTAEVAPGALHGYFAGMAQVPVIVSTWYDDLMMKALAGHPCPAPLASVQSAKALAGPFIRQDERPEGVGLPIRPAPLASVQSAKALAACRDWGMVQGVSQSEHFGTWVQYFDHTGAPADEARARDWATLLYQPLGSIAPAANFLVSDTDFVEVLTEIDIQTPIPAPVQERRKGRHFLFLGCRFNTQLDRLFARQIMKRSSDRHWALLEGELTRNEARFLAEQNIQRIDMSLAEFLARTGGASTLPLATAV
jgi:hypothetical protein